MYDSLELVLLLLAMAVVVVVTFRILNLPETIGYLLVGVCVGPNAFGLIPDSISARHLAEFGIVFLMFSIGLEFSLSKLLTMKRIVFGYGFLQVVFSTGVFYLIWGGGMGIADFWDPWLCSWGWGMGGWVSDFL